MPPGSGLALDYAFVPSTTPILASAPGANPNTIDLQVIVSNPGLSAHLLSGITIQIPTGQESSRDISTSTSLPSPTYDTSSPWSITTSGSTIAIAPVSGASGMVSTPVTFTLPAIQVDETPGTVPITITEVPPPPAPRVSDATTYTLLKEPADFPITSFWVDPPALDNVDQPVTLYWTCSDQGKQDAFGLRIAGLGGAAGQVSTGVSTARLPGSNGSPTLNDCVSDGTCYTALDGEQGVTYAPVDQTTTFALDAVQTTSWGQRTVVATVEATVQVTVPTISQSSYLLASPSGRLVRLHWLALNADWCTLQLDGETLDRAAPTDTYQDGYPVFLPDDPAHPGGTVSHQFAVIAHTAAGPAQASFIFPTVTVTPTATMRTGVGPLAVAISPGSLRALIANFSVQSVTVLSFDSSPPAPKTIPVGLWPVWIAITPDGSTAIVCCLQSQSVWQVDIADGGASQTSVQVTEPTAVAITPDGSYALIADAAASQILVVDVTTWEQVADPIPTGPGPGAVAITPDGTRAFIANTNGSTVTVIDVASRQALANAIEVGQRPVRVAFTPDGRLALVTVASSNRVAVIDVASGQVQGAIPVGNDPLGIAITPDGSHAIVANVEGNALTVIEIASKATWTLPVGNGPTSVAVAPNGLFALATNSNDNTVSVI